MGALIDNLFCLPFKSTACHWKTWQPLWSTRLGFLFTVGYGKTSRGHFFFLLEVLEKGVSSRPGKNLRTTLESRLENLAPSFLKHIPSRTWLSLCHFREHCLGKAIFGYWVSVGSMAGQLNPACEAQSVQCQEETGAPPYLCVEIFLDGGRILSL